MTRTPSDWVSAFPEDDEPTNNATSNPSSGPGDHPTPAERPLPPARKRTRTRPLSEPARQAESLENSRDRDEDSVERTDYEVGYCKPPRNTRFKPGRSGNPKGRPKGAKSLNTIVRENLTQKVAVRTQGGAKKISRIEAIMHKVVEQAMKGNPRALAELIKLYGSAVPEEKENEGAGGQEQDLTAADLATLEAYRLNLQSAAGEQP